MSDGFSLFSGGRLSSISRVSSWLESYTKMPKHTISSLLQVKFSVSDNRLSLLIAGIKMMLHVGRQRHKCLQLKRWWAPPCVPEIDAGDILQLFGKMFFEFCQESGYDTILRVLGSNVREFLQVSSRLSVCSTGGKLVVKLSEMVCKLAVWRCGVEDLARNLV